MNNFFTNRRRKKFWQIKKKLFWLLHGWGSSFRRRKKIMMVFTIYTVNMMITIYESNGNIRFFLTHFFRGCQEQPSNPCQVNTLKTGAWFLNIIPTLRSFYMWMLFFWMKSQEVITSSGQQEDTHFGGGGQRWEMEI